MQTKQIFEHTQWSAYLEILTRKTKFQVSDDNVLWIIKHHGLFGMLTIETSIYSLTIYSLTIYSLTYKNYISRNIQLKVAVLGELTLMLLVANLADTK